MRRQASVRRVPASRTSDRKRILPREDPILRARKQEGSVLIWDAEESTGHAIDFPAAELTAGAVGAFTVEEALYLRPFAGKRNGTDGGALFPRLPR